MSLAVLAILAIVILISLELADALLQARDRRRIREIERYALTHPRTELGKLAQQLLPSLCSCTTRYVGARRVLRQMCLVVRPIRGLIALVTWFLRRCSTEP